MSWHEDSQQADVETKITHYRRRKWTKVRVFILAGLARRVQKYRRLERAPDMVYMAASGSHSPYWLTALCSNACAPTD